MGKTAGLKQERKEVATWEEDNAVRIHTGEKND